MINAIQANLVTFGPIPPGPSYAMLVRTVFIHDFAHVPQPYSVVRERLINPDSSWVRSLASEAYRDGEALRLRVGPRAGGRLGSKVVRIHLGTPYEREDSVVIPMSWAATGRLALFPSMEADLEIAPLGDEITQVTLSGMYEPPLGKVGKAVDALVLHRLAEATIRSFLSRLANGITLPPAGPT